MKGDENRTDLRKHALPTNCIIARTPNYQSWFDRLDVTDKRSANLLLDRVSEGNFSAVKSINNKVAELRKLHSVHKDIRIYGINHGGNLFLALHGGGKNRQRLDIQKAKEEASKIKSETLELLVAGMFKGKEFFSQCDMKVLDKMAEIVHKERGQEKQSNKTFTPDRLRQLEKQAVSQLRTEQQMRMINLKGR